MVLAEVAVQVLVRLRRQRLRLLEVLHLQREHRHQLQVGRDRRRPLGVPLHPLDEGVLELLVGLLVLPHDAQAHSEHQRHTLPRGPDRLVLRGLLEQLECLPGELHRAGAVPFEELDLHHRRQQHRLLPLHLEAQRVAFADAVDLRVKAVEHLQQHVHAAVALLQLLRVQTRERVHVQHGDERRVPGTVRPRDQRDSLPAQLQRSQRVLGRRVALEQVRRVAQLAAHEASDLDGVHAGARQLLLVAHPPSTLEQAAEPLLRLRLRHRLVLPLVPPPLQLRKARPATVPHRRRLQRPPAARLCRRRGSLRLLLLLL
eukprot:Rhum_TRINITY_DN14379_c21_g1::Rhum_TRINITY_DN14379_c21_g1_i1::g.86498::m.86498